MNALLSVTQHPPVVPLARALLANNYRLVASPSTALAIQTAKLPCQIEADITRVRLDADRGTPFSVVVVTIPDVPTTGESPVDLLRDGHFNLLAHAVRDPMISPICRGSDYEMVIADLKKCGSVTEHTQRELTSWACHVLSTLLHYVGRRIRNHQPLPAAV